MNPPPSRAVLKKINCVHPEHDDPTASLAIYGYQDVYCFGCHRWWDELGEYMDSEPPAQGVSGLSWLDVGSLPTTSKTLVKSYIYTDENGNEVKRKNRYEPKDFRWEGDGAAPLLYNLPGVIKADTVFLVEGEKDADRLIDLGYAATTTGASHTWKPELASNFGLKSVVILPDNDPAGYKYAQAAYSDIREVAKSVKIIELPGLPDKGDVSDWLDIHSTAEFEALIEESPDTPPLKSLLLEKELNLIARTEPDPAQRSLYVFNRDKLKALGVPEFLIPGRLQKNTLAQLAGPSEVGKSLWAIDACLRLTTERAKGDGKNLFGQTPISILYLAAEGLIGIAGRIQAWEEKHNQTWNEERLGFRSDVPLFADEESFSDYVEMVYRTGPWDLLVIDTLARSIPGLDENSAEAMGLVVRATERLRKASGGGILLIHHFGWNGDRQRGSSALYGACDNILYLTSEGEDPNRLLRLKTEKLKDGVKPEDAFYDLVPVGDSVVIRDTTQGAHREAASRGAVLEFLREQDEWLSTNRVREGVGLREQTVTDCLRSLLEDGLIETDNGPRNALLWRAV